MSSTYSLDERVEWLKKDDIQPFKNRVISFQRNSRMMNMNAKFPLASVLLIAASFGAITSVSAKCLLYEHRDFAGDVLVLQDNEHAKMVDNRGDGYYYRPDWNDRISSYKVSANCTLFMWEHVDGKGWKLTRTGQMNYIGDRRNDKVSEAQCSCTK